MQTHDWENMSQNERDRLVDGIVAGVKEKYVGSSVTPRHIQVVQGELQRLRDKHGMYPDRRHIRAVRPGCRPGPFRAERQAGRSEDRHTPDDLYEELRGDFRTKSRARTSRACWPSSRQWPTRRRSCISLSCSERMGFLPSGQWRNDRQHGDAGGSGACDDHHGGRPLLRHALPRRRKNRRVPAAGQRTPRAKRRTCKSARWSVSRSSARKRPVASRSSTPWIFPKRPSSTRTTSGTPR